VSRKPRHRGDTGIMPPAASLTLQPTVTISGLAAALAPIAPDEPATVQHLRHWTREGMLPPVQHAHSGPGKHRVYAKPDAVYEAAILHLFNDMGLPISGSRILTDALDQVRREIAKRKAGKGKKALRLIIAGGPPTGMTTVRVYGQGEKVVDHRDTTVTIAIDLEKLFAQLEHGRGRP
jgi:DNA-binding transcriptional MerR regulator